MENQLVAALGGHEARISPDWLDLEAQTMRRVLQEKRGHRTVCLRSVVTLHKLKRSVSREKMHLEIAGRAKGSDGLLWPKWDDCPGASKERHIRHFPVPAQPTSALKRIPGEEVVPLSLWQPDILGCQVRLRLDRRHDGGGNELRPKKVLVWAAVGLVLLGILVVHRAEERLAVRVGEPGHRMEIRYQSITKPHPFSHVRENIGAEHPRPAFEVGTFR